MGGFEPENEANFRSADGVPERFANRRRRRAKTAKPLLISPDARQYR